jgi:hypothetical protein
MLTGTDVTATLKAKLGEQIEDYVILGACNPPLAHKALIIDRSIGLLLPCNVVVRAAGTGSVVEALDPQIMVTLTEPPGGLLIWASVKEDSGKKWRSSAPSRRERRGWRCLVRLPARPPVLRR